MRCCPARPAPTAWSSSSPSSPGSRDSRKRRWKRNSSPGIARRPSSSVWPRWMRWRTWSSTSVHRWRLPRRAPHCAWTAVSFVRTCEPLLGLGARVCYAQQNDPSDGTGTCYADTTFVNAKRSLPPGTPGTPLFTIRGEDHGGEDAAAKCASRQPAAPARAWPRDSAVRDRTIVSARTVTRCAGIFLPASEPDPRRHADPLLALQEASLAHARADVLPAPSPARQARWRTTRADRYDRRAGSDPGWCCGWRSSTRRRDHADFPTAERLRRGAGHALPPARGA